ncbi:MAG: HIRAN domain-containing protein [Bacteroidia bacterium]|nr:HIRAN domain-containing protein [Bacteroidia bacterium]
MNRIDFLKRLVGVIGLGGIPVSVLLAKRKVYLLQCFVAGFRHYKGMELLDKMEVNDFIELRREPDNEYDEFAVALYWQQEKIGFLPADFNETIARLIDAEALPLLAVITHLNREVKPWENVVVAVYFLQKENTSLAPHAAYLQELATPEYTTLSKYKPDSQFKENDEHLMGDFYNLNCRIIHLSSIPDKEAKEYYTKYYGNNKVWVRGVEHALVDNDGHYHYMYQNKPVKWVTADDGEEYILFEFDGKLKN